MANLVHLLITGTVFLVAHVRASLLEDLPPTELNITLEMESKIVDQQMAAIKGIHRRLLQEKYKKSPDMKKIAILQKEYDKEKSVLDMYNVQFQRTYDVWREKFSTEKTFGDDGTAEVEEI